MRKKIVATIVLAMLLLAPAANSSSTTYYLNGQNCWDLFDTVRIHMQADDFVTNRQWLIGAGANLDGWPLYNLSGSSGTDIPAGTTLHWNTGKKKIFSTTTYGTRSRITFFHPTSGVFPDVNIWYTCE